MTKNLKREALGILVAALSLLAPAVAHAANPVDATQAEAMLRLLERCHAGRVPAQAIDQVMDLPGTRLIIGQQNVSRRVTAAQYREVLASACRGEIARVTPSEPGARAEKGARV
jgi:NAD dependent epimerase/dehydratase family enzyme